MCEEELPNGDEFHQCRKCEYDVCAGCFKRHASKSASSTGKFGLVADKLKSKDKKDQDKKSAGGDTEPVMDADDTRVFAFTGFPPQADPAEALTLIKDYIHDFLGDFAAVVLGVCVGDGEIGVSYPVSQGEAIHATIHELRDKFVYRGVTLSTCDSSFASSHTPACLGPAIRCALSTFVAIIIVVVRVQLSNHEVS